MYKGKSSYLGASLAGFGTVFPAASFEVTIDASHTSFALDSICELLLGDQKGGTVIRSFIIHHPVDNYHIIFCLFGIFMYIDQKSTRNFHYLAKSL